MKRFAPFPLTLLALLVVLATQYYQASVAERRAETYRKLSDQWEGEANRWREIAESRL